MAFVSTCTGTQDCSCGACGWDPEPVAALGWDAIAEQVANNWDSAP
ncbi:uncharacterized protein METZ01_LOCUS470776, partial [marine metagenome]